MRNLALSVCSWWVLGRSSASWYECEELTNWYIYECKLLVSISRLLRSVNIAFSLSQIKTIMIIRDLRGPSHTGNHTGK